MSFWTPTTLAALIVCFGVYPSAAAQDLSNKTCLECHAGDAPVVDAAALGQSAHRDLECRQCHAGIADLPHEEKLPKVECGSCHDNAVKEFNASIHAEAGRNNAPDMPSCATCHGKHDVYPRTDIRSFVNRLKIDATCLQCHANREIIGRHRALPSQSFVEQYTKSVHGRGVHLKGLVVSATCSDCHGHHAIRPKNDPRSTVSRKNIPATCRTCHLGIVAEFETSAHGVFWKNGESRGPVCTTCHKSHDIEEPTGKTFQMAIPNECGGCHKEEASTYRDTFHGKATSLGYVVSAKCSDCHTPHHNLAKEDPASSVHPNHLRETCGKCHPDPSPGFVEYNPHADPEDRAQSPLVHDVAFFMKWLLVAVFSFFGLHTLLWAQRSIVAAIRKEFRHPLPSGTFVRRFSRSSVATHVVMVVSFLGLAATGLPLKYNEAGWASAIADLLGGIEVTRAIHRFCAILTFGYGLFHLVTLTRRALIDRKTPLFWGSDSLVPSMRDIVDLFHNLRWFLYLGKPPRFGRWTYFEKFDYFAVFWGIPVIGLSGLMLWFPGFFSSFLPGAILNIAAIVHSEEAILAVGFIFTFHLFHNHLRPENFPLDTVIFTGALPMERLLAERPEEYAEAVRSNRLSSMMIPAPPPEAVRRAKIFGYAALTISVLLILAIFFSYAFGGR